VDSGKTKIEPMTCAITLKPKTLRPCSGL